MNTLICFLFSLLFSFFLCKFDGYELPKRDLILVGLLNSVFTLLLCFSNIDIFPILCLIIIMSILNIVFMIDFKFQEIPNIYVVILILFAIAFHISKFNLHGVDYSLLIKDGLLYVMLFMGLMVVTGGALGAGDVKLSFPIGMLLTNTYYLEYIGYTFLSGAIVALILLLLKKYNKKDKIAFGPFMIVSYYFIFLIYYL